MISKYKVTLNTDEHITLKLITTQGKHSVRKIKRAQTLLMSHAQIYRDEDIAESLSLSFSTVYRTKRIKADSKNILIRIRNLIFQTLDYAHQ